MLFGIYYMKHSLYFRRTKTVFMKGSCCHLKNQSAFDLFVSLLVSLQIIPIIFDINSKKTTTEKGTHRNQFCNPTRLTKYRLSSINIPFQSCLISSGFFSLQLYYCSIIIYSDKMFLVIF